jgi:uncharacterized RDD family membrane protein YckC
MSDLVTGEAVVVELRLARLPTRALGILIDQVIQWTALLVLFFFVSAAGFFLDEALLVALTLVVTVAVIVGYPLTMETLTRGRTVGKLALGLRVVRDDGGSIRFRHALVRALFGVVEFWVTFGAIAIISSLLSAKGKRLGDIFAGTVVIRERVPVHGGPVATMPPQLAYWASGLELAQLTDDLALEARQFLARANELAPEVREDIAHRLADEVFRRVSPPPPRGIPATAYLSAVLAERRRRELGRLNVPVPPPYATSSWYPPYGGPPTPPARPQPVPPAPAVPSTSPPTTSPPTTYPPTTYPPTQGEPEHQPDNPFAPPH